MSKKRKYWDEQEDQLFLLMRQAKIDNNEIEFTRLYNRLFPKLYKMAEAIMNRYGCFLLSPDDFDLVIYEALTNVAVNCYKYKPENGTMIYSYVGTIIRNYFKDVTRKNKIIKQRGLLGDEYLSQSEKDDDLDIEDFWDYDRFDSEHYKEKLTEDLEKWLKNHKLAQPSTVEVGKILLKYLKETETSYISIDAIYDVITEAGYKGINIDSLITSLYDKKFRRFRYVEKIIKNEETYRVNAISNNYDLTPLEMKTKAIYSRKMKKKHKNN